MAYYLEIWLRGFAKDYLRKISLSNPETFHPHITLVRPFEIITSEKKVRNKLVSLCEGIQPIKFVLEGKSNFDDKFFYIPVVENEELISFDSNIEKTLESEVSFSNKLNEKKILHATINTKENFLPCPRIEQYMLRLTGIKNKKIWFSYDFVKREVLTREQSLDQTRWYETVHEFTKNTGLLPTRQGYREIK